ncbi:secreted RxLR effector protein 161-like [Ricinus communis]|uniref:secreted RxLR effector protein 161-like n=1 Tax=Ricinus communis TaxID=3988 RepID=UPI00201AFD35|nr:secreted RxLR effector protein 161-like [Ricinus communis]
MKKEFEMTDLREMKYFLGIEINQGAEGIHICQRKYAEDILARFGMTECNGVKNPMVPGNKLSKQEGREADSTLFKQMVGSLMYITATRLDLMYGVCLISRFMSKPMEIHMLTANRILRYIRHTTKLRIFYKKESKNELTAYTDSDYAGDNTDFKSTSGYTCMMNGGAVTWMSKKQPIVTLSSIEAEYVAAATCACQCVWMRAILKQIGEDDSKPITVLCDNSSSVSWKD